MSTAPKPIDTVMQAYFAGKATQDQAEILEAWLREDPSHVELFVDLALLDGLILKVQKDEDAAAILNSLCEVEENAEADLVTLVGEITPPRGMAQSPSASDYVEATRYLFEQGMSNKRMHLAVGSVLAAAVFILVAMLWLPFGASQSTTPTDSLANTTFWDTPTPTPTPTHRPVVATLTNVVSAQWRSDDEPVQLPVGVLLTQNQRLTLTHGFAEITTNRGAIALLEAPCTIEFTDNDNAIRLHQGKLVGKCLTRHSKGFSVITPSIQVIDLGTEFGVAVSENGDTNLRVFDGLVALAEKEADPRTAELTEVAANQAKHVDLAGRITAIDHSDTEIKFVQSLDPGTRYESMILADKPLVYYRMDQVIGGVERNLADNRYHAKIYGGVQAVTPGHRSSFLFGSFGDYLQTTEPIAELRGAKSYTVECWVKPRRYGFGSIFMLGMENDKSDIGVYAAARLEQTGSNPAIGPLQHLRYSHTNKTPENDSELTNVKFDALFSNKTYALSRWVYVAVVKEPEALSLYVNGSKSSEVKVETPLLDQEHQITIGRYSTSTQEKHAHTRQFLGEIDELAVYDYALSPDAIRARYEAGKFWLANE